MSLTSVLARFSWLLSALRTVAAAGCLERGKDEHCEAGRVSAYLVSLFSPLCCLLHSLESVLLTGFLSLLILFRTNLESGTS